MGWAVLILEQRNTFFTVTENTLSPSTQYLNMESRKSEIQPSLLSWPRLKTTPDQQIEKKLCFYLKSCPKTTSLSSRAKLRKMLEKVAKNVKE